jgi:hypothetical protein
MRRRSKWLIVICLLILAGVLACLFWPREPELVTKAKLIREGMTTEEVIAIMGKPSNRYNPDWRHGKKCEEWVYSGGHDTSDLFSREFPFLTWTKYRDSKKWAIYMLFWGYRTPELRVENSVYCISHPGAEPCYIHIGPPIDFELTHSRPSSAPSTPAG